MDLGDTMAIMTMAFIAAGNTSAVIRSLDVPRRTPRSVASTDGGG